MFRREELCLRQAQTTKEQQAVCMKVKTKARHRGGRVKTNDPLRRIRGISGEDKLNDHHTGGMSHLVKNDH